MFLNKTPPAWAKGLFITIKDLCTVTGPAFITADEFIKSHTPRKHIHNPGYLDYLEILKLIPKDQQSRVKQNNALPEQDTVKAIIFSSLRKWQEKNIAKTQYKDLYRALHQRKIIRQCQWNKYDDWQQQHYTQKLTKKQWEQLFLSLYQNTKQKEAFDIQYKFLHFAQPSLNRLREAGQNYGSTECIRCNRADETQKHWLFSCASSQNIFIYLLCLLEYIDITQVIDNTVEDCRLYHLLEYEKEVPACRELFETYFITIRCLRTEATYGNKYTREEELKLFKNNIRNALTPFITFQKYTKRKSVSLESGEK